jgi:hypothetical protein
MYVLGLGVGVLKPTCTLYLGQRHVKADVLLKLCWYKCSWYVYFFSVGVNFHSTQFTPCITKRVKCIRLAAERMGELTFL